MKKKIGKFTQIFDHKMWFYDIVRLTGVIPVLLDLRVKRLYIDGKMPKDLLKGRIIVCANHNTYVDPVITFTALWRRRMSFIATKDIYVNKLAEGFFKAVGAIQIDKQNVSLDTFKQAREKLDRGHAVAVFPEGSVKKTTEIREFKSGTVLMSIMCDADLLPIYIVKRASKFHRQVVVVGNRINCKEYLAGKYPTIEEVNKLTQLLQAKEQELKDYYGYWAAQKAADKKTAFYNVMLNNPNLKKLGQVETIPDLLTYVKEQYNSLPAVIKPDKTTATFNDLYQDVLKVASSIQNHKGNIGLLANNDYWFEVASLAIMATGNTAVLLPAVLNSQQVAACCKKFDVKFLIHDEAHSDIASSFPIEKQTITKLLQSPSKFAFKIVDVNDPACIILTGGTTGAPKGVVLSHQALMRGTMNGCYGLNRIFNQKYYCMIPLTHSFGLVRNMLTALYTGSLIYYNTNKLAIFNELQSFKPTTLVLVPQIAELFLSIAKNQGKAALGNELHTIICGSANVPKYLPVEFHKLNIDFFPGYGLTEMANIVTGNVQPLSYPQSVGVLFPEQEAKIVDGELWLKGKNMFSGYYNDPQATEKAFSDGWFKTGDLAKFDEYGNLYILGRTNDLIVLSSGEKVSPAGIEAHVLQIDLVKDALVYLPKSEQGVSVLTLEVTLRPNLISKDINAQEYLQSCVDKINEKLQPHEKIRKIIIRDKDFERTPLHKIIRKR